MTDRNNRDVDRILRTYEARSREIDSARYSPMLPANIVIQQERDRVFLAGLVRRRIVSLADRDILEIGCGSGGELVRLVGLGAAPGRLHGIDLRADAIAVARGRLAANFVVGDASSLPYPDASFDLVIQLTALSSMLSTEMRRRVAHEMARVLRPDGVIMSYDFWVNPSNRNTVGISTGELRRLFPGWRVDAHRLTLAPPIARRVAPVSMRLASLIGLLPFVRTHFMAFIERGKELRA